MTSKEFKQTAKTVCTNFQKHARAMESDLQMLIQSMLDVIDSKILALKKLLKLRAYIKQISALDCMAKLEEASIGEINDSLQDLSSMVFEPDQNSLPHDNNNKRKYLSDIADLKSFCLALHGQKTQEAKKALEKYIYHLSDIKSRQQIGDQQSQKKDSLIYLGKTDYESVLDILNMVLKSYEMQENGSKRDDVEDLNGRKIASACVCLDQAKRLKDKKQSSSI